MFKTNDIISIISLVLQSEFFIHRAYIRRLFLSKVKGHHWVKNTSAHIASQEGWFRKYSRCKANKVFLKKTSKIVSREKCNFFRFFLFGGFSLRYGEDTKSVSRKILSILIKVFWRFL